MGKDNGAPSAGQLRAMTVGICLSLQLQAQEKLSH